METLTISGTQVQAVSPEGQTASLGVPDFIQRLTPLRMDTGDLVLPDGVKATLARGKCVLWVHQTPPRVTQLRWIADDSPVPYGPGGNYRLVKLALPYVVVLAIFTPGPDGRLQLGGFNECFFRNEPLEGLDDELCYPALLNCSKFSPPEGKPLSWICTQYLDMKPFARVADLNKRMKLGLKTLLHCLFDTGFNYSSEHHEGASWFSVSRQVDPRLTTVDAWQQASEADPLFVLDVPWMKTGMSVRQVADRIFDNLKVPRAPLASAADLARVVFNSATS